MIEFDDIGWGDSQDEDLKHGNPPQGGGVSSPFLQLAERITYQVDVNFKFASGYKSAKATIDKIVADNSAGYKLNFDIQLTGD